MNNKLDPLLLERLACPHCMGILTYAPASLRCEDCDREFKIERGVPLLIESRPGDHFDYLEHYKKDAEVFDYFQDRPSGTAHEERRLTEYILSELGAADSVLDVGCGSAWVAKHFQNSATFVCSLDATLINTAKALDRYQKNHAAVVADAFHLPFRDGSFDAIIASEIIEHVVDPAGFVAELFRVLIPGGSLVITTPYKETLRYTLCIHCNENTPINAHLHSFDEAVMTALYKGKDLARVSWKTFGNKALLHLRTHKVMGLLPFGLWKLTDAAANKLINARAHILVKYEKAAN